MPSARLSRWAPVEYGETSLLVTLDEPDRLVRWGLGQQVAAHLLDMAPVGLVDIVASFGSVSVEFDPVVTDHATIAAVIDAVPYLPIALPAPRFFHVPVVYGGEHGPDLSDVARELGLSDEALIAWHTGSPWTIRFRGAPAASPMADGPIPPKPIARQANPRVRVPGGSVGVSGQQAIIYPVDSPGGWRLLGRTPLTLLDPSRDPVVPYLPGDELRYHSIGAAEWDDWTGVLADRLGDLEARWGSR